MVSSVALHIFVLLQRPARVVNLLVGREQAILGGEDATRSIRYRQLSLELLNLAIEVLAELQVLVEQPGTQRASERCDVLVVYCLFDGCVLSIYFLLPEILVLASNFMLLLNILLDSSACLFLVAVHLSHQHLKGGEYPQQVEDVVLQILRQLFFEPGVVPLLLFLLQYICQLLLLQLCGFLLVLAGDLSLHSYPILLELRVDALEFTQLLRNLHLDVFLAPFRFVVGTDKNGHFQGFVELVRLRRVELLELVQHEPHLNQPVIVRVLIHSHHLDAHQHVHYADRVVPELRYVKLQGQGFPGDSLLDLPELVVAHCYHLVPGFCHVLAALHNPWMHTPAVWGLAYTRWHVKGPLVPNLLLLVSCKLLLEGILGLNWPWRTRHQSLTLSVLKLCLGESEALSV